MPLEVVELLKRRQEEQEHDPSLIEESEDVEQDPLFVQIRAMVESGEASRLLNGRGY